VNTTVLPTNVKKINSSIASAEFMLFHTELSLDTNLYSTYVKKFREV